MAISIRNPSVEIHARDLSLKLGVNMTEAIDDALVSRLSVLQGAKYELRDAIMFLAAETAALPDLDARNPDEILGYDVNGA